jgi:hypothetical protein
MMIYKFVLKNHAPLSTTEADDLSSDLSMELGNNDWHLVSTTLIPSERGAGLLLGFEREVEGN